MASSRCGAAGHSGSKTVPEPLAPRRPTSFSFFLGACSRLPRPSVALYCQLALCLALSSVKWANSWLSGQKFLQMMALLTADHSPVSRGEWTASGSGRQPLSSCPTLVGLSLPVTSLQKEFWDPQGPGVSTMQGAVRGERGLLEKGLVHAASSPPPQPEPS